MQRIFDIIFATIALFLLSPLLIPIIIILRFTGEGEIFFIQKRIGMNKNNIKLFKFATMLKDSPNLGSGTVTLHNDPRILPFGSWLRKTKINELPQLINILIGDMSIIGPRPQAKKNFDAFPDQYKEFIIKVRPGLSGVGSIVFRNEEEILKESINPNKFYNDILMPYKGELEMWYVKNRSLKNYFLLIAATFYAVATKSNLIIFKLLPLLPPVPKSLRKELFGLSNDF